MNDVPKLQSLLFLLIPERGWDFDVSQKKPAGTEKGKKSIIDATQPTTEQRQLPIFHTAEASKKRAPNKMSA